MNRKIFFCKLWFRGHKKATDLWPPERAKEAHEAERLYTVLVDSIERPNCYLDITNKFVGVSFLDENLRDCLEYHFQEIEPGQLFLSKAVHRQYNGSSDTVTQGDTFMFKPDGRVHMRKGFFNPHRLETADTTADVRGNYSPFPEFGEYDDLIRKDR